MIGVTSPGTIYLGLYNSPIDFLEEAGMLQNVVQPISTEDNKIRFENLPSGEYALSFYIDENGNDEMDYNFIGMPKEPYGFYTDPGIIFARPKFKDVSFQLNESLKVEMKTK